MFSNKTYDILKWIAQIVLPAIGTLYFGLASIWGFPYGEEVVGTITVLDTFLGALLGISATKYAGDGTMYIDESDPNKDVYSLELDIPIDEMASRKTISFKVGKEVKKG